MPTSILTKPVAAGDNSVAEWSAGASISFPENLPFVGLGNGATQTTTRVDGAAISEEFSIGDELHPQWAVPRGADRTINYKVSVHFYLNTSEVGKVVSWRLDVGASNGVAVNTILQTINATDVPVAAQYIDAKADFVVDSTTVDLNDSVDALLFKLVRIASSDDPTAAPRVHLIEISEA